MTNWLPGRRYIWRELAPRAVLLTVMFKYLVPNFPFDLLEFHGGILAAGVLGLAFTGMFMLIGSYLMGLKAVGQWMERHNRKWWFIPANLLFLISFPAMALLLAQWAAPATLSVHGLLAALLGSLLLNVACALTHDWGAQ